ncbi:MAG: DUF3604 domain-containing protein [Actinomycetota bacterium]|nr:DUF3604 domain-containing protein [Actinomycetota bacterium]
MAAAIEDGRDVSAIEPLIDPDPLRYMWVDEGGGRIGEFLERAEAALDSAQSLPGHLRAQGRPVRSSGTAARPSVAAAPDGRVLHTWIEWEKGAGDRVLALLSTGPDFTGEPEVLSADAADCFRPTAFFDAEGRAWVCYARADDTEVRVWCRRRDTDGWGPEELVSTTTHPSFNQEVTAHADGSVEVCWQAPLDRRFGIYARRWRAGAWERTRLVSAGADGNVWDPSVAAVPGGGTVYAWCEYSAGSYRIMVRTAEADGTLSTSRPLSSGTDYALHPSLAVTADGAIWCAFDLISVTGHGGSGPTRLRPTAQLTQASEQARGGEFWPPDLMPEITASIQVVRVDADGLRVPSGVLAADLDVVPSGLPRLVAGPDGGLTIAYRVHRRLPLATYYWEVAVQSLGPDGWSAPTTFAMSDGTLEEPSVAPFAGGALVAWQTDGRLERALTWTEGFGGRECPYLLEHHGDVVWHGMHGTGSIVSAVVTRTGRATVAEAVVTVHSSERREVRSWAGTQSERYTTVVKDEEYTLYWGDLHRHSLISRCTAGDEPSLEDFYRYSWDVCEYDFWAITDHAENSTDYQWWSIQKMADLFRVDGRFVPFYGFEWTGLTGHQNVIYGDVERGAPIFSAYAEGTDTPAGLWENMDRYDLPAISIPHHPGSAMVPYDWDYYDPKYQRLVEVFQACRGNYEDDGCFRQYSDGTLPGTFVLDGLRRDHRFGLIASSDHGYGAAYVGAYAQGLDRSSVFDALYERRVFGATQRDIVVDFRMGDVFMGDQTVLSGPVDIEVYARGYGELSRIDVVRNGTVVHRVSPDLDLKPGWIAAPVRVEWGLGSETTDWSGALSIDGGEVVQTPYWSPEITEAASHRVAWTASTKTFGEPYGSQRGGVELTLVGPPDAVVTVTTRNGELSTVLGAIEGGIVEGTVTGTGRLRIQPAVGGLMPLGCAERRVHYRDTSGEPGWYYVRVYQTDGEMAWSSPIWVDMP